MPVPSHEPVWWGSLIWLIGVAVTAFAVAWLSGTRLHIRRVWYVPLLFVVTAGLTVGYLAWLGVGFGDVVAARWGWGLFAAMVAAILLYKPCCINRPHDTWRDASCAGSCSGTAASTASRKVFSSPHCRRT